MLQCCGPPGWDEMGWTDAMMNELGNYRIFCFYGMLGKRGIPTCQFIMELSAGKYIYISVTQML